MVLVAGAGVVVDVDVGVCVGEVRCFLHVWCPFGDSNVVSRNAEDFALSLVAFGGAVLVFVPRSVEHFIFVLVGLGCLFSGLSRETSSISH